MSDNNSKHNIFDYFFMNFVAFPLLVIAIIISFFLNYPLFLFVIACFLPSPCSVIFMVIAVILEIINIKVFNKSGLF